MSKPVIHGRDHRPGRSDTIPGVVVYHYENVGDWLYIETTHWGDDDHGSTFGQTGMLFHDTSGAGIAWWCDSEEELHQPQVALTGGGWLGYLDGGDDLVYTQTGSFLRYTGGGGIGLYSADGAFSGSGDIIITTVGTDDDATATLGNILLDNYNFSGGTSGEIILESGFVGIGGRSGVNIFGHADGVNLFSDLEIVAVLGDPAADFHVKDSSANQILRVDEDGTVHMKTGAVIVADL